MANFLRLDTFASEKGSLTVFEKIFPSDAKRLFYIYGVGNEKRGGHAHKTAINALICVAGECKVYVTDGEKESVFLLDSPEKCLVLDAPEWHEMYDFSENSVLLVVSDKEYDQSDYVYEKPKKKVSSYA